MCLCLFVDVFVSLSESFVCKFVFVSTVFVMLCLCVHSVKSVIYVCLHVCSLPCISFLFSLVPRFCASNATSMRITVSEYCLNRFRKPLM